MAAILRHAGGTSGPNHHPVDFVGVNSAAHFEASRMTLDKAQWRTRIRAWRRALPAEQHARWSQQVLGHLRESEAWSWPACIGSFVGVRGEVDTRPLLDDPRVVLPVTGPGGSALRFRWPATLEPGRFGIPEPTGAEVALSQLQLVLVPALAIDAHGRRLGQGGGYYDRTLGSCNALRVALLFSDQLVPALPTEPHDLCVHAAITERGWVSFGDH